MFISFRANAAIADAKVIDFAETSMVDAVSPAYFLFMTLAS